MDLARLFSFVAALTAGRRISAPPMLLGGELPGPQRRADAARLERRALVREHGRRQALKIIKARRRDTRTAAT